MAASLAHVEHVISQPMVVHQIQIKPTATALMWRGLQLRELNKNNRYVYGSVPIIPYIRTHPHMVHVVSGGALRLISDEASAERHARRISPEGELCLC